VIYLDQGSRVVFSDLSSVAVYSMLFNPLNAKLNPICHLLALLGAHPILHFSRVRVNDVLLYADVV